MITIVTISWNNLQFTKDFVESLNVIDEPFDLLIYDNGSTDGTLGWLKQFSKLNQYNVSNLKNFQYCYHDTNNGMPIAWNWGLSYFDCNHQSDIIYLCNNDIRMTSSMNKLPEFIRSDGYGLVCPGMLERETPLDLINEAAETVCKNKFHSDELHGPLMAIHRDVFDKVGFFCEDFKFSFEDCDYFERCKKAGLICGVYYGAYCYHYGGASTSKLNIGTPKKDNIYYDRFQKKHG